MKEKPESTECEISFKDPDMVHGLCEELGITEAKRKKFFEFSEYGKLKITVNRKLDITSAEFVKVGR